MNLLDVIMTKIYFGSAQLSFEISTECLKDCKLQLPYFITLKAAPFVQNLGSPIRLLLLLMIFRFCLAVERTVCQRYETFACGR